MMNMMNMISVPAMNSMMSEDVNAPALRNPMNHLSRKQPKEDRHADNRPGWIDAWLAVRGNR